MSCYLIRYRILASLNLPAALDDVTNHEELPESIRQKSSKVKSQGGIDALINLIADLPNVHKRNEEILDEVNFFNFYRNFIISIFICSDSCYTLFFLISNFHSISYFSKG